MNVTHWTRDEKGAFQRPLGPSERAYFPVLADGTGDMFLHLAFVAPKECMRRARVVIAWAIIRHRHPLLQCKVGTTSDTPANVPYFSYLPALDSEAALKEASGSLSFQNVPKDELISDFLNGPRLLSNESLSWLIISSSEKSEDDDRVATSYGLLLCAPHFTGDGLSLHQSTHEFLSLLASPLPDDQLLGELDVNYPLPEGLPPAIETRFRPPKNRLAKAASEVNFLQILDREIGGHRFPRHQLGPRHTVFFEKGFTQSQTAAILKRCKNNGVTVNHVLSVICNVVWARIADLRRESFQDPLMMYTAVNLRSYLEPHPAPSYWFVALTYFNIVLPSFPPANSQVFWHRARLVKTQTRRIVQSQFLVPRARQAAEIRAKRVWGVAHEGPSLQSLLRGPSSDSEVSLSPAPSSALLGLSLIGNLDAIYLRSSYSSFHLSSVATASRQKAGGLLLLQHTFDGKLWLNLCWDKNGFEKGLMESFWAGLEDAVEEFLV